MTPLPHPSDVELARYADGADDSTSRPMGAHVRTCLACQLRLARAEGTAASADDDAIRALADAAPRLPAAAQEALNQPRGLEPAPGQLWRLTWRSTTLLAVLLDPSPDADQWLAVPVTTDPEWADQYTLTLGKRASPLGVSLAIWVALRTHVPSVCLDRPLGHVGLRKVMQVTYEAFLEDVPVPDILEGPTGTGTPIVHPADERWEYRENVAQRMAAMSAVADELSEAPEKADIATLLQDRGIELSDFAQITGLAEDVVYDLVVGTSALPSDKVDEIAELLGVPADTLPAPRTNPEVLLFLARPHTRDALERISTERHTPVGELWMAFEEHCMTIAARTTGRTDPTQRWEQIFHAWINSPR